MSDESYIWTCPNCQREYVAFSWDLGDELFITPKREVEPKRAWRAREIGRVLHFNPASMRCPLCTIEWEPQEMDAPFVWNAKDNNATLRVGFEIGLRKWQSWPREKQEAFINLVREGQDE